MSLKSVLFLGTSDFTLPVFQVIQKHCQILGVCTKKRSYFTTLPFRIFTPDHPKDPEFIATIKDLKPDLCVTASYGFILPQAFLDIPSLGTLNVHPSLLPQYRGPSPVQRSIEKGEVISGVSIVHTVLSIDAGPLLKQRTFPILPHENSLDILNKGFILGAEELDKLLPSFLESTSIESSIQDPALATKAPKISKEEGILNFKLSALELHNKVRAFYGWPGTFGNFVLNEKEQLIKIIETIPPSSEHHSLRKDGVFFDQKYGLGIPCGKEEVLFVRQLHYPGKRPVLAKDFWNGLRGQNLKVK